MPHLEINGVRRPLSVLRKRLGHPASKAIIGSLVAARFARRLPADRLRRWFAYLVFAVTTLVVGQLIIDPVAVAGS